jgi:hypothetical protein
VLRPRGELRGLQAAGQRGVRRWGEGHGHTEHGDEQVTGCAPNRHGDEATLDGVVRIFDRGRRLGPLASLVL